MIEGCIDGSNVGVEVGIVDRIDEGGKLDCLYDMIEGCTEGLNV